MLDKFREECRRAHRSALGADADSHSRHLAGRKMNRAEALRALIHAGLSDDPPLG